MDIWYIYKFQYFYFLGNVILFVQICYWMYTHVLLITLRIPCCILYHYVRFNDKWTHMSYWQHYLHYVVCQIIMSDLIVNAHTCFTDSTTYTLVHVRSICLIYGWMQTYMLLITLLTPRCLSDLSVWFNEKCTHMFKWKHYLHNVVCQINMFDLMMHVHTCATAITTYTIVHVRSLYQI